MFSKDITEHDSFLEMPLSTQSLYFHLGMQADDDGFVSPNRIMRMIGAQVDDLKILITKKFILAFADGVVVIKHWKLNNYLRVDRYRCTKHKENMALIKEKSNGSYSWYTTGIPDVIPVVDAGKVRIGKVSTTETSSEELKVNPQEGMTWNKNHEEDFVDLDGDGSTLKAKKKDTRKYPNAPAVRKVFQEVLGKNPGTWRVNKTQLLACENLYTERGVEKIRNALLFAKEHEDSEYCPKVSSPYDLDSKWANLGAFKIKNT